MRILMIRRLNYTGRIRLQRSDIKIVLKGAPGAIEFNADLNNLTDYDLPPESLIFIEAYRQTSWMRFSFGSVGKVLPAENRKLTEFDSPEGILFRIKITKSTDTHTLLAQADRIPLTNPEESDSDLTPLLPGKPQKLGDEIYRLEFDNGALLLVNSEAGDYSQIVRSPIFASLAYPSIFREVLMRVLVVDAHDDDADPDDWRSQWSRFAKRLPGLGELPEPDKSVERIEWIDNAVSTFSQRQNTLEKFVEFWQQGEE